MRTISTDQSTVLGSRERATHLKVEVNDGASWIDLSTLQSMNWLESVRYSEGSDSHFSDATIILNLKNYDLNLSPLVTGSKLNDPNIVLGLGNTLRIYTAIMPMGIFPSSGDWILCFRGAIDDVSITSDKITVRCRDEGGDLADAYIEDERFYGTSGGQNIETVMQNILNDWGGSVTLFSVNGTAGTPFNAGDSPGWAVKKYLQRREPVLSALKTLADMIGYELRYRWQTNTSDFELIFYDPYNAAPSIDYTFAADHYFNIATVNISRKQVRNVIRVNYRNSATAGTWETYEVSNAASIAKYGRLFMAIEESSSSQVDTNTEAALMANAILNAFNETTQIGVQVPYFPFAQIGDYYSIPSNNHHIDTAYSLAVHTIEHQLERKNATSKFTLRGLPSLGLRKWLINQEKQPKRELASRNFDPDSAKPAGNKTPNGDFGFWGGK